ncbi:MAG: helix-turn-helix domain-containing protein [Thermoplasmata archaeon]
MNVEKLIRKGESSTVEFKESLKLRNMILEAVSSLSNSTGGVILVGITDSGKISGVDVGENTLERLANRIKQNTDPQVYPEIITKKIDEKEIVVIRVKESQEKPVFYKDKAYKRVGKSTHKLNSSEIRNLAKTSGKKTYWDEQICEEATLDDIDKEKVKNFLKKAKRERNFRVDYDSIDEALKKLDLLEDNNLTNACILMFAEEPQRFFLQSETKCGRFKGTTTKEFIDMAEFSEPVHEQVDSAEKFVMKNIRKAAWIEPGKVERQEKWEYPLDAVREAITNAIVHRDYQTTSKTQVRIFDDRIEIWNPGRLPEGWSVETLKQKHESKPFNPLLAKIFFLGGYIEEWGRGTVDMIEDTIEHGLPEPEFEDTGTAIVVTFRKKITDKFLKEKGLNERQIEAVKYLKENERIKREKYSNLFDIGATTAYKELDEMIEKGIINRRGKGRGTYYVLRTKGTKSERKVNDSEN